MVAAHFHLHEFLHFTKDLTSGTSSESFYNHLFHFQRSQRDAFFGSSIYEQHSKAWCYGEGAIFILMTTVWFGMVCGWIQDVDIKVCKSFFCFFCHTLTGNPFIFFREVALHFLFLFLIGFLKFLLLIFVSALYILNIGLIYLSPSFFCHEETILFDVISFVNFFVFTHGNITLKIPLKSKPGAFWLFSSIHWMDSVLFSRSFI